MTRPHRTYPPELKARALYLLLIGRSVTATARALRLPKGTVSGWSRSKVYADFRAALGEPTCREAAAILGDRSDEQGRPLSADEYLVSLKRRKREILRSWGYEAPG